MRSAQILKEGTDNLYHSTSPQSALKILTSGEFRFTSMVGTDAEQSKQHKDYEYYLSCTRSKVGDYHARTYASGVMMNLDGRWINQRYPVKPVDYWDRMWYNKETGGVHDGRTSEAEDRIFSKEPTMPITPLQEVHIYWSEKAEGDQNFTIRRIMIEAKKKGYPTYLYSDLKDWLTQNKNKSISVKDAPEKVKGPERQSWGMDRRDDYLNAWVELYYKKSDTELSEKGKRQFRELRGWGDTTPGLKNDLHNARTPGRSGYKAAQSIIKIMRENKWTQLSQFVNFLKDKWDAIAEEMRKRERAEWEAQQQEKQAANEDYDWEQDPGMDFINPLPIIDSTDVFDFMEQVDAELIKRSGKEPNSPEEYGSTIIAMRDKYGSIVNVTINKIVCTEKYLDPDKIKAIQSGNNTRSSSEFPLLYKHGNRYIAGDGNHRIVAAHLNGEKMIQAQVLDLRDIVTEGPLGRAIGNAAIASAIAAGGVGSAYVQGKLPDINEPRHKERQIVQPQKREIPQLKAEKPKAEKPKAEKPKAEPIKVEKPKDDTPVQTVLPPAKNSNEEMLRTVAQEHDITGIELIAFLAQMEHESGGFNNMVEDHPNVNKYAYGKVAKILGNKNKTDAQRFIGRGFIQLTGRWNYEWMEKELGIDLSSTWSKAHQAADPKIAAEIAVAYWKKRVQPRVKNFINIEQVTKPINPSLNGLEDRKNKFKKYLAYANSGTRST